jgi:hypothetical protein
MVDAPGALNKQASLGLEPFGPDVWYMTRQCDLQSAKAKNGGQSLDLETGHGGSWARRSLTLLTPTTKCAHEECPLERFGERDAFS